MITVIVIIIMFMVVIIVVLLLRLLLLWRPPCAWRGYAQGQRLGASGAVEKGVSLSHNGMYTITCTMVGSHNLNSQHFKEVVIGQFGVPEEMYK